LPSLSLRFPPHYPRLATRHEFDYGNLLLQLETLQMISGVYYCMGRGLANIPTAAHALVLLFEDVASH